ncbi:hypothetical protein ANN_13165 [Periplaneta americana]|uniref:Uncharacterized protein n=1 Tax=Periplaneta americana TaxID=6978 RepID=A0ABQ8TIN5_PERAM|nr:hypothetical protein ANN_13165 [Periplaneta americana]
MSPGSNTESYPAFAHIGLRENLGKNLNQVTCPDRELNPGHLVSRPDALTVTPQKDKINEIVTDIFSTIEIEAEHEQIQYIGKDWAGRGLSIVRLKNLEEKMKIMGNKRKLQESDKIMEREMLNITLRHRPRNEDIRSQTQLKDAAGTGEKLKKKWAGHVMRLNTNRLTHP